jgi:hypothetical protein
MSNMWSEPILYVDVGAKRAGFLIIFPFAMQRASTGEFGPPSSGKMVKSEHTVA